MNRANAKYTINDIFSVVFSCLLLLILPKICFFCFPFALLYSSTIKLNRKERIIRVFVSKSRKALLKLCWSNLKLPFTFLYKRFYRILNLLLKGFAPLGVFCSCNCWKLFSIYRNTGEVSGCLRNVLD